MPYKLRENRSLRDAHFFKLCDQALVAEVQEHIKLHNDRCCGEVRHAGIGEDPSTDTPNSAGCGPSNSPHRLKLAITSWHETSEAFTGTLRPFKWGERPALWAGRMGHPSTQEKQLAPPLYERMHMETA